MRTRQYTNHVRGGQKRASTMSIEVVQTVNKVQAMTKPLKRPSLGQAETKSMQSVSRVNPWEGSMVVTIALAFGCKVLWQPSHSTAENAYGTYVFVGPSDHVDVVRGLVANLVRQTSNARRSFNRALDDLPRMEKHELCDLFCERLARELVKQIHPLDTSVRLDRAVYKQIATLADTEPNHQLVEVERGEIVTKTLN